MSDAPYPYLDVQFEIDGYVGRANALIDTGFDGHFAVPASLIQTLPEPTYIRRIGTATGEIARVPAYLGTVEVTAQPGRWDALIISLGDEYLIGLATVNHFRMTFDHGRRVIVEP